MKKTIYALFLMIICLFPVAGCNRETESSGAASLIYQQNAFRIIKQIDSDGKLSLVYVFPVNSKILTEKGFKENEIRTYRFYLTTYVNALAQQNRENVVTGVTVGTSVYFSDVDGIGFSIEFENIDAQKRFFNIEDNGEGSSNTKAKGLFVKTTKIKTSFPVSSAKSAGDLKLVCSMAISSWCSDNSISAEKKNDALQSLSNAVYIYDFANTQYGLKSKIMYQDEKYYHNFFVKTLSEIEQDNEIVFWMTSVNRPLWYMSALFIVLLGVGFAFFALRIKNKKAK